MVCCHCSLEIDRWGFQQRCLLYIELHRIEKGHQEREIKYAGNLGMFRTRFRRAIRSNENERQKKY